MKVKTALIWVLPFLFLSSSVLAAPEDFIISEIMYSPSGADGDKEWVEIFHNSSQPTTIQLGSVSNSLRLIDGSSNRTLRMADSQKSATISAQNYFVIAREMDVFKASYPTYTGTLIEASMDLHGETQMIGFRLGSGDAPFSQLTYDKSWGGNVKGRSTEKIVLTGPNNGTNWAQSASEGGTPGEAYEEPEKVTYPDTVKINEFVPDPKLSGDREWVELYNSSSDKSAVLTDWQLDDEEGGASPKMFSASIAPLGYYVYYFTSPTLNNDGDTVRLVRPDSVVTDSFNYTKSRKGFSYAVFDGAFAQTSSPTPGEKNVLAGDPDLFEGSIVDIKKLPLGHKITLTALVSAPESLLGDKDLYVWDKDTGIKISYGQDLDQSLSVGDKIKVSSSLEESNNERYIKTEKISLLQKQAGNVEALKIKTGEATENNEGRLVEINGKLEEQSGDTFYLDDGSGRAKVFIKDSTGIVKVKMSVGDEIRVVGVVSQYAFLKDGTPNYRILPRFQSDIYNSDTGKKIEEKILGASTVLKELPVTGFSLMDYRLIGWGLIFLGLSFRLRWHKKNLLT